MTQWSICNNEHEHKSCNISIFGNICKIRYGECTFNDISPTGWELVNDISPTGWEHLLNQPGSSGQHSDSRSTASKPPGDILKKVSIWCRYLSVASACEVFWALTSRRCRWSGMFHRRVRCCFISIFERCMPVTWLSAFLSKVVLMNSPFNVSVIFHETFQEAEAGSFLMVERKQKTQCQTKTKTTEPIPCQTKTNKSMQNENQNNGINSMPNETETKQLKINSMPNNSMPNETKTKQLTINSMPNIHAERN